LGTKFCRLNRRCQCIAHRFGSPRCHQDSYSKQELREPRERIQDRVQHDEARRFHLFLQGIDSQAAHDWSQACLLLLARPDPHSCLWQDYVISSLRFPLMSVIYGRLGVKVLCTRLADLRHGQPTIRSAYALNDTRNNLHSISRSFNHAHAVDDFTDPGKAIVTCKIWAHCSSCDLHNEAAANSGNIREQYCTSCVRHVPVSF
jgi:hypothetical protein